MINKQQGPANGNSLQSQPHQRTKSIRLRRLFQILAAVIGVEEQHFPGLISVRLVVNADGKFRAGWKSLRKLFKSVSWELTDPRAAGSLGSASSAGSAESAPSASSTDNATMQAFAWTSQISKVRLLGNSSSKSARRELVEEIGLRCLPVIYGGTCESSPPPVDLQRACNYLMWFEARAAQKREKEARQVLPAGREIVHTIRAASLFTASMAAPLPPLPSAQGAISSRGRPVDGVSMTASEQKEAEPSSASAAPPRSKPARQSGTPHRGSRASPRSSPKTSPQSSPARGTTSGPSAGHARPPLPALSLPSFRPAPVLSAPLDMKTSANKSSPSSQSYSALQHEPRRMRVTEGVSMNCFKSRGSRTSVHRDRKYRDGYPDDDDDEGHSDEGDTLVDLSDENTRRTSLSSTGDNCRGNSSDEENHDNDFDGNN